MVFRGIPYAAPPWVTCARKPALPEGLEGMCDPQDRSATTACSSSRTATSIRSLPASPRIASTHSTSDDEARIRRARRPVMVWIHGGGFFAGFGGEERHNGAPRRKGRRRRHAQLSTGTVRFPRASGARSGIATPYLRQLRAARPDCGAQMGPTEHQSIRRRSESSHDLRRIRWRSERRDR